MFNGFLSDSFKFHHLSLFSLNLLSDFVLLFKIYLVFFLLFSSFDSISFLFTCVFNHLLVVFSIIVVFDRIVRLFISFEGGGSGCGIVELIDSFHDIQMIV